MSRNFDEGKGFRALAKEIQEAIDKLENGGGSVGPTGPAGPAGADGAAGATGATGAQGEQGVSGNDGATGSQGEQGIQGIQGIQGVPGNDGADGNAGAQGDPGEQGIQGIQGIQGVQGEPGAGGDPLDAYPVGAVYISSVSTSPATLFGGTWTALENIFLVAAKAADADFAPGATGGARTVTLTAAQSGSPAHTHTYRSITSTSGSQANYEHGTIDTSSTASENSITTNANSAADAAQAHTNLPPFKAFYMWERTA
jgi:hypothetical protein